MEYRVHAYRKKPQNRKHLGYRILKWESGFSGLKKTNISFFHKDLPIFLLNTLNV